MLIYGVYTLPPMLLTGEKHYDTIMYNVLYMFLFTLIGSCFSVAGICSFDISLARGKTATCDIRMNPLWHSILKSLRYNEQLAIKWHRCLWVTRLWSKKVLFVCMCDLQNLTIKYIYTFSTSLLLNRVTATLCETVKIQTRLFSARTTSLNFRVILKTQPNLFQIQDGNFPFSNL